MCYYEEIEYSEAMKMEIIERKLLQNSKHKNLFTNINNNDQNTDWDKWWKNCCTNELEMTDFLSFLTDKSKRNITNKKYLDFLRVLSPPGKISMATFLRKKQEFGLFLFDL